jgi:hypothetical protein
MMRFLDTSLCFVVYIAPHDEVPARQLLTSSSTRFGPVFVLTQRLSLLWLCRGARQGFLPGPRGDQHCARSVSCHLLERSQPAVSQVSLCAGPPHVHVERERSSAKFWIDPVVLSRSHGFARSELLDIQRIVAENEQKFRKAWDDYFGNR